MTPSFKASQASDPRKSPPAPAPGPRLRRILEKNQIVALSLVPQQFWQIAGERFAEAGGAEALLKNRFERRAERLPEPGIFLLNFQPGKRQAVLGEGERRGQLPEIFLALGLDRFTPPAFNEIFEGGGKRFGFASDFRRDLDRFGERPDGWNDLA